MLKTRDGHVAERGQGAAVVTSGVGVGSVTSEEFMVGVREKAFEEILAPPLTVTTQVYITIVHSSYIPPSNTFHH